jgi:hypothetical protein
MTRAQGSAVSQQISIAGSNSAGSSNVPARMIVTPCVGSIFTTPEPQFGQKHRCTDRPESARCSKVLSSPIMWTDVVGSMMKASRPIPCTVDNYGNGKYRCGWARLGPNILPVRKDNHPSYQAFALLFGQPSVSRVRARGSEFRFAFETFKPRRCERICRHKIDLTLCREAPYR